MVAYRSGHVLIRVVYGRCNRGHAHGPGPLTISLWFVMWGVGQVVAVLDRYLGRVAILCRRNHRVRLPHRCPMARTPG